jgi:hypothetical protein
MTSDIELVSLDNYTWLRSLEKLYPAYPVLRGFTSRLFNENKVAREIVLEKYKDRARARHRAALDRRPPRSQQAEQVQTVRSSPSRCVLLTFHEDHVDDRAFISPEQLSTWIRNTPNDGRECRLWLLEDLEPAWLEVLGSHLHIDPLAPGEQMNTFHFTGS